MQKKELNDDPCEVDDSQSLLGFDESNLEFYNATGGSGAAVPVVGTTSSNNYFRWTPESIKMMLTMRFGMDLQFSQPLRQKKELWNEIAAEMEKMGHYVISGEVCDLKFRNMLQTYKKNRLKEDRGMQELIVWEYYSMFKDAMVRKYSDNDTDGGGSDQVIPSMLCESVCYEDDSSGDGIATNAQSQEQLPTEPQKKPKRHPTSQRVTTTRRSSKRIHLLSAYSTQTDTSFEEQFQEQQKPTSIQLNEQREQTPPTVAHSTLEATTTTSVTPDVEYFPAYSTPPAWITPIELKECEFFGQSVGLQLANVRDSYSRALLKLKIQELLFLAGTGKLSDKCTLH